MEVSLRHIVQLDGFILMILGSLGLLVLAKTWYPQLFNSFFRLLTNYKYVLLFNKGKDINHPFHLLVLIASWLNASLFLYLIIPLLFGIEYVLEFMQILIFIMAFSVLKQLMQLFHGYIFKNKRIRRFLFAKASYFNLSSWLMLLSSILLLFTTKDDIPLIYLTITGVILINLTGFWQVLRINQKYILSHFFYFILYLCAFEIAPFIILSSYLKFDQTL